ncbi:ABC transporter permease [Paenibacillus crassostreae]|uniref:Polysaccharide ABC transporter ATP-binding protein n=1 Tax=Paenibacillus crassostreae TaxID=1763538 RepID=A0A167D686_9BACL|nr:sugar ABC transporter permease [Paenibacillus crassostreae]AOZ91786.1 polysaccharide ABC transporter ATP-binding protein [Paenibacillus crassostreae]OAB73991.1 polysaccharide ABC transporter ATP-binding protein [Paenibacillus crassostreae]
MDSQMDTAGKTKIESAYKKSLATERRRSIWNGVKRDRFLYLLALPGIVFFILFKYVPMWGIVISFQDYSPYQGMWASPWVGFEHYIRFFSNPDFLILFRNTMAINLLSLVFFFPLPILLSVMMNELRGNKFRKTIQSIVYLPHFLSWVIIVGITFLLLSTGEGIINQLLVAAGLNKIDFLTNSNYFWGLLTVQSIWKDAGWGTVLFLAAMAGIDPQLNEAAKIDGAGRFRQIWHITLPGIRSVVIILLILRIGHIMDVGFEQVFLMTNGAVSEVADVFDTYVYRLGIKQGQLSFSTAVGVFKSLVGLILVVGANKLAKKFGEDGVY